MKNIHYYIIVKWCEANNIDPKLISITPSTQPAIADISCNIAFIAAKKLGLSPSEIAKDIVNNCIQPSGDCFETKGFINWKYSYKELLNLVYSDKTKKQEKETYLIDFGGPNIAKQMHVGHLRSLVIGSALVKIGKSLGKKISTDIHYGDWGLQMGLMLAGDDLGYVDLENADINILAESYSKLSALKTDDEFLKKSHEMVLALQRKNPSVVEKWKTMVQTTKRSVDYDLNLLDIKFDDYLGESDSADALLAIKAILPTKVSEGALVVGDDDPPLIIQNKFGGWLYSATDLATIAMRKKYNNVIYVVDQRQQSHFKAIIKYAPLIHKANYEHVGFGTVNGPDGKPFKTREGGVPKLSDLLHTAIDKVRDRSPELSDEDINRIGVGCVKFSDLLNNRIKNYSFDIDNAVDYTGMTAAYIMYQYCRTKQWELFGSKITEINGDMRPILVEISHYQSIVELSWKSRQPHHLAQYMYRLSALFSSYYGKHKISGDRNAMALASLFCKTIREGMACLNIKMPSKM